MVPVRGISGHGARAREASAWRRAGHVCSGGGIRRGAAGGRQCLRVPGALSGSGGEDAGKAPRLPARRTSRVCARSFHLPGSAGLPSTRGLA